MRGVDGTKVKSHGVEQSAMKVPAGVERNRASMVAFVQDERDGSIVQAIRMPLSECRK